MSKTGQNSEKHNEMIDFVPLLLFSFTFLLKMRLEFSYFNYVYDYLTMRFLCYFSSEVMGETKWWWELSLSAGSIRNGTWVDACLGDISPDDIIHNRVQGAHLNQLFILLGVNNQRKTRKKSENQTKTNLTQNLKFRTFQLKTSKGRTYSAGSITSISKVRFLTASSTKK